MTDLIKLSEIKRKGIDPFLVKTVKAEGNVYLDELFSGQYLVSHGEIPITIHTSEIDAIHWFEKTCKQYN